MATERQLLTVLEARHLSLGDVILMHDALEAKRRRGSISTFAMMASRLHVEPAIAKDLYQLAKRKLAKA